jgi:oxalate decarboxylase/phosphoglucose isomerase-like protein (cupin superfamily)
MSSTVQQAPGIKRTDLQRHDLSVPGREVIQNRVNAGDALLVPAETVHAVRNVGGGNAAELATYFVEKGKPLVVVVE